MERRQEPRELFAAPGAIFCKAGDFLFSCVMRDFSANGGRLELSEEAVLPRYFLLSLMPDGSNRQLCSKVWQLGHAVGVRFIEKDMKQRSAMAGVSVQSRATERKIDVHNGR